MAFVLKKKNRRHAFAACGNGAQDNPAVCIFSRFPRKGEQFYSGEIKNLFSGVKIDFEKLKGDENAVEQELAKQAGGRLIDNILNNLTAQSVDYKKFARECIDGFENFAAEGGKEIKTAEDLLSLPEEYMPGAEAILEDCYRYAVDTDDFSPKN